MILFVGNPTDFVICNAAFTILPFLACNVAWFSCAFSPLVHYSAVFCWLSVVVLGFLHIDVFKINRLCCLLPYRFVMLKIDSSSPDMVLKKIDRGWTSQSRRGIEEGYKDLSSVFGFSIYYSQMAPCSPCILTLLCFQTSVSRSETEGCLEIWTIGVCYKCAAEICKKVTTKTSRDALAFQTFNGNSPYWGFIRGRCARNSARQQRGLGVVRKPGKEKPWRPWRPHCLTGMMTSVLCPPQTPRSAKLVGLTLRL